MTDEHSDPDAPSPIDRLASEFIDGELDDAARAEALSDPETSAVIEAAIRDAETVRNVLADVEPAPISMRERHLAAALDAWDRLPEAERTGERRDTTPADVDGAAAAGAAAVTAPPAPLRRKPRRNAAWLTAAAASLVLVLAGGLVLRAVTDGADEDQGELSSADLSGGADTTIAASTEARAAAPAADGGDDAQLEAEASADMAVDDMAGDSGLTSDANEALNENSTLPIQPNEQGPPPDEDLVTLLTADDVAAFAAAAIDAPRAPDVTEETEGDADEAASGSTDTLPGEDVVADAAEPLCERVDLVVGRAIYNSRVVIVGIDLATDVAFAHVPETCLELVRVALP